MAKCFLFLLLTAAVYPFALAQGEDKVDVFTKVSNPRETNTCREFKLGSPIESITPVYPPEARSLRLGGAVRVEVLVSEDGTVADIIRVEGEKSLAGASREAALKTKFTPSWCDTNAVAVTGVLIFNFVPLTLADLYTVPDRAAQFTDIDPKSAYYESVLSLTENYRLAFGYADGKFHPEAPMSKGDFAHFLRLTLDLLQNRAEISRKIPREIDLYFPLNPLKLRSSGDIADLDSRKPYGESVGFLISKYDIALTNEKREFHGKLPVSYNELIGYWKSIFGNDAVPVNFSEIESGDRVITRGEFALFLHESLYVLTYKVLP